MAKVKLVLDKEEREEKRDLLAFVETLSKEEKIKLKGFLEGVAFLATSKGK